MWQWSLSFIEVRNFKTRKKISPKTNWKKIHRMCVKKFEWKNIAEKKKSTVDHKSSSCEAYKDWWFVLDSWFFFFFFFFFLSYSNIFMHIKSLFLFSIVLGINTFIVALFLRKWDFCNAHYKQNKGSRVFNDRHRHPHDYKVKLIFRRHL